MSAHTEYSNMSSAPDDEILQAFYGMPTAAAGVPACFRSASPREDGGTVWDVWNVHPTGNPWADEIIGREIADDVITFARRHNNPRIVAYVQAIIVNRLAAGELTMTGIESGFLDRIARLSYLAAHN